jgi:hypothetical protein
MEFHLQMIFLARRSTCISGASVVIANLRVPIGGNLSSHLLEGYH